MGGRKNPLQSTPRRGCLVGDHIQHTLSYFPIVQRFEGLLSEVESSGGVDGGHDYPIPRRRFGQLPAPATVRRVPHNTGRAADMRKGGNVAERRESRHETVRPV